MTTRLLLLALMLIAAGVVVSCGNKRNNISPGGVAQRCLPTEPPKLCTQELLKQQEADRVRLCATGELADEYCAEEKETKR